MTVEADFSKPAQCEFYNNTECEGADEEDCYSVKTCDQTDNKRNQCFALWKYNASGEFIQMKDCFYNNQECYNQSECVEKREKPLRHGVLFCCCEGDMCNRNFSWNPMSTQAPTNITDVSSASQTSIAIDIIVPIILIITLAIIGWSCWFFKRHKKLRTSEAPSADSQPLTAPLQPMELQIIEAIAKGRFGTVYKANFNSEIVAVKVFPLDGKQSWLSEKEIFDLPHMNHVNILQFIGADQVGEDLQIQFRLVTAFHEKGSVSDYLRENTISWYELCKIAESIARGLMFLHDEIPGNKCEGFKPTIAHRDFKSKNVLLKSDMTACIADFGLALIFHPDESCGDIHNQVGTRRYMAPEVLEGAINFSKEAFLRIDMYACGLVLWELVSRTYVENGPVSEYKLPFEKEIGQNPSLEDMQDCVLIKKIRPVIQDVWRQHSGLSALCDTIEECWDYDPDARLSASCVLERITYQSGIIPSIQTAIKVN